MAYAGSSRVSSPASVISGMSTPETAAVVSRMSVQQQVDSKLASEEKRCSSHEEAVKATAQWFSNSNGMLKPEFACDACGQLIGHCACSVAADLNLSVDKKLEFDPCRTCQMEGPSPDCMICGGGSQQSVASTSSDWPEYLASAELIQSWKESVSGPTDNGHRLCVRNHVKLLQSRLETREGDKAWPNTFSSLTELKKWAKQEKDANPEERERINAYKRKKERVEDSS